MPALICGSFAYDSIMVFDDHFKDHIMPDKVHILNISFLVPDLRREFGGCGGNITYNMSLLDNSLAIPVGTVGKDFSPYNAWLDYKQIDRANIKVIDEEFTAQAFITTDLDDNQITAFHPGAMNYSHENNINDIKEKFELAIISPDGHQGMIEHATQLYDANIKFIFDPGQQISVFSSDELKQLISQSTWITLNDYEWHILNKKTDLTEDDLIKQGKTIVVTHGSQPTLIHTEKEVLTIPVAKADHIADPTGCGDAFRAGFIYGLLKEMDLKTCGHIASLMGTIKVESSGTQNHAFSVDEFAEHFEKEFGYNFQ